jgi:glutamine synthetase
MDALNRQALRIFASVRQRHRQMCAPPPLARAGILSDRSALFNQRRDLIFTGHPVGARPPRCCDDDHYFGVPQAASPPFMGSSTASFGSWASLQKPSLTKWSRPTRAGPVNHHHIATDHNQLTMEMMQKIAANTPGVHAAREALLQV